MNTPPILDKICRICIVAITVALWILQIYTYLIPELRDSQWSIADTLINYQGGFVRRGLTGEILYHLSLLSGISPVWWIFAGSIACYLLVAAILFRFAGNKEWNWIFLCAPGMCGLIHYLFRKDYMMFLALIAIYLLISRRPSPLRALTAAMLAAGIILCHEAFVFFGILIPALYLWRVDKSKVGSLFLLGCAGLTTLLSICFKGDNSAVSAIISSWENSFNIIVPPESNLGALGWDALGTFWEHLTINFFSPLFQSNFGWPDVWGWIAGTAVYILMWFSFIYMALSFPIIFLKRKRDERLRMSYIIGALLIILSLSLLPMMTILSCDRYRVYQYLTMGAFIPVLIIPDSGLSHLIPRSLYRCSRKAVDYIFRIIPPNRTLIYIIMILYLINFIRFDL